MAKDAALAATTTQKKVPAAIESGAQSCRNGSKHVNTISSEANTQLMERRTSIIKTVRTFFGEIPIDWFTTLTFRRRQTTILTAVASWRSFLSQLRIRTPETPVRLVLWSAESQHDGTAHLHALCAGGRNLCNSHCDECWPRTKNGSFVPDPPAFLFLNEAWWHHYGVARWLRYDDSIGCGGMVYAAKYLFKEANAEWGLWEIGKDF